MIKILRENGDCGNSDRDGGQVGAQKEDGYVVYLAALKSDEDKCELCEESWISDKAKRHHITIYHNKEYRAIKEMKRI